MKEKQGHIYFIAGSSRSEVGFGDIVISLVKGCDNVTMYYMCLCVCVLCLCVLCLCLCVCVCLCVS